MRYLWPISLVVLLLAVGCGDDENGSAEAEVFRDRDQGFTVTLPEGWHRADESLTPNLTNPREILSAGTFEPHYRPNGGCAHAPVSALADISAGDAFITIQESFMRSEFPPRKKRLRPPRIERGELTGCFAGPAELPTRAPLRSGSVIFRDAGRDFYAFVWFGLPSSAETMEEAFAVLDSLHFTAKASRRRLGSGVEQRPCRRKFATYLKRFRGPLPLVFGCFELRSGRVIELSAEDEHFGDRAYFCINRRHSGIQVPTTCTPSAQPRRLRLLGVERSLRTSFPSELVAVGITPPGSDDVLLTATTRHGEQIAIQALMKKSSPIALRSVRSRGFRYFIAALPAETCGVIVAKARTDGTSLGQDTRRKAC